MPGFDTDAIEDALGQAADLATPHVLEFALAVGVARGGLEVWRGRIPVEDLPAWLVIDGAARGMLSFGGSKIGGWVGLVALGPAGALVLAPTLGAAALIGSGWGRDRATRMLMGEWLDTLMERAAELMLALRAATDRRIARLERRVKVISVTTAG